MAKAKLYRQNNTKKHAYTHSQKEKKKKIYIYKNQGFPGGAVVENPPTNAGDTGSSPGLGRFHMPQSN